MAVNPPGRHRGHHEHGDTLVFDASTPIAISHMRRPDLLDRLRDLGYDLAVPSHVDGRELIRADVRAMIDDLLDRGAVRIVRMNRWEEVLDLGKDFPGVDPGECDAILTCIKMRRGRAGSRCVLDDKKARAAARRIGIEHVGLAGLLGEIASAGLVSMRDMGGIVAALRKSNFYIGDDLLAWLARDR